MEITRDIDPVETREWREALGLRPGVRGTGSRQLPAWGTDGRGAAQRRAGALLGDYALHQHHPAGTGGAASRRPRDRAPHPLAGPLERDGDGRARQQGHRPNSAATSRASRPRRRCTTSASIISGTAPTDDARRRPGLHPGPLLARHLRPRLPRRPADRGAAGQLPPGSRTASGLSSYPHPWLMPDFWQFPTVSMGLGPLMAIYQARFLKYLQDRGLADTAKPQGLVLPRRRRDRRAGDRSARSRWPSREQLDNLIFVINCNLQRLDGPVRGNGKIIQELEADFRGAGWNVIKVIWGSGWDALLAARHDRPAASSAWRSASTASTRTSSRRTAPTCASTSSASIRSCRRWSPTCPTTRSGSSTAAATTRTRSTRPTRPPSSTRASRPSSWPRRSRATAWARPARARTSPTSRRRWASSRCANSATASACRSPTTQLTEVPFYSFAEDSPEMQYLHEPARGAGRLVCRRGGGKSERLEVPPLSAFDALLKGSGEREISTTMAFVRILNTLLRDKTIGKRVVPIVPDEARTFGMEGMFRQFGIYSQVGQLYQPEDAKPADVLPRGRKTARSCRKASTKPGAMSSWIAAATSYSTQQRADDPVLHLLLDVRLPARRRPGLGGRRHACPRLPARRHRRPHDAQRRGPAARGRAQPPACPRRSRTASPTTRLSPTSWR